jgi:DNA polymerase lambda/DNA polymerase IV
VSEAPQVFRGLSFYYIPDNDIAPARKLRIARAQGHGAQRVRDLLSASHVIVDKQLKYKDIENIVGSDATESLVIVNEDYPIDCMSFRTLLNPDQNRYKVAGHPVLAQEPASSQTSDRSLQVKEPQATRRRGRSPLPGGEQPPLRNDNRAVEEPSKKQTSEGASNYRPAPDAPIYPSGPPFGPPGQENKPLDSSHHTRQGSNTKDELSEYIELLQQYKHLPLDREEDDFQSVKDNQETVSDSDIEERSEDERARKRSTAKTRRGAQKSIPFEERFACNRGGTKDKSADTQNPNAKTIEILQSMCDYYTRINDNWRTMAYRKAITTLRRQSVRITTEEEAYLLPNIGARLAAKIEEIVSTNKLRRLEYVNNEPVDQVLETFLKIYDVGTSRANKWIAQGFRTLDDLRQKADLTPNQRLGIDHYDSLNTRIPRDEVAALFAHVQREAAVLDPAVELLVGGSYRRGADSSGDIDIIITKKGTDSSVDLVPFLEELVAILTRKGFLVATLAALHANRPGKDGPGSKWHGCCVLPSEGSGDGSKEAPRQVWRRIDLLLVPESEYGAALVYFTGNDIFNRSMRLLASKKGMRLNQRGLYKEVMRGKGRVKVTEGELVEGRDEKRIFELLGVKWREPWERWC